MPKASPQGLSLTKSSYSKGIICPKNLWLEINKPELKPVFSDSSFFEEGNKTRKLARSYFGKYSLVPYNENKAVMQEETSRLIAGAMDAKAVCAAVFAHNGNFCSVDLLLTAADGLEIIEIKSSASVKPSFLDDLAYQYYIVKSCGWAVENISVLHINGGYVRKGPLEIDKLFTLTRCTDEIIEKQNEVEGNIQKILEIAGAEEEPLYPVEECANPYCVFKPWCYKDLPQNNIFNLNCGKALEHKAKISLYSRGITSIEDLLASNEELSPEARLIAECEEKKLPPQFDKKAIEEFVNEISLNFPVYHLDFETFKEMIPSLDNQSPYQQIPFQYSLHIQKDWESEPEHREFLGEIGIDPRRLLAQKLCEDIPKDVYIAAYYMPFEKERLQELARLFPDLHDHLINIHDNLHDLIIPFQKRIWYSRLQRGSNSLKAVLPAMFPGEGGLDYHALDQIHNGGEASSSYMALGRQSPKEREKTKAALLAYCRLDTYAMVKILQKFYLISRGEASGDYENN